MINEFLISKIINDLKDDDKCIFTETNIDNNTFELNDLDELIVDERDRKRKFNKAYYDTIICGDFDDKHIGKVKQKLKLTEEDEHRLICDNPSFAYLLGIKEKKEPDNDAIWWDNFYSKLSDDEKREIRDIQLKQLNEKEEREKRRESNKNQSN